MGNQALTVSVAKRKGKSKEHPLPLYRSQIIEKRENLGGCLFLNSYRCTIEQEGDVVVKQYVKPPESKNSAIMFKDYEQHLTQVRTIFRNVPHPNLVIYSDFWEAPDAAYLFRQYFKSNLLDRLSTPPHLSPIEKRWIAYQLLQALVQCHSAGVCHGDIKLSNIVLTSWDWALLTDFAFYKPATFADREASSVFRAFFSSSRRDSHLNKGCLLAPERFVDTTPLPAPAGPAAASQAPPTPASTPGVFSPPPSASPAGPALPAGPPQPTGTPPPAEAAPTEQLPSGAGTPASPAVAPAALQGAAVAPGGGWDEGGVLTPAMDIFSMGCVIAQLFLEHPLFDFSALLAYSRGPHHPPSPRHRPTPPTRRPLVTTTPPQLPSGFCRGRAGRPVSRLHSLPPDVAKLVAGMIALNPAQRPTAQQAIDQGRMGTLFPYAFARVLHLPGHGLYCDPDARVAMVAHPHNFAAILADLETTARYEADHRAGRGPDEADSPRAAPPARPPLPTPRQPPGRPARAAAPREDQAPRRPPAPASDGYAEALAQCDFRPPQLVAPPVPPAAALRQTSASARRADGGLSPTTISAQARALLEGAGGPGHRVTPPPWAASPSGTRSSTATRPSSSRRSPQYAGLDVLQAFAEFIPDHDRINRITPLVVNLLADPTPSIRMKAIETLCQLLASIRQFSRSYRYLYHDYILPQEECVKITWALHFSHLARSAYRFLNMASEKAATEQEETHETEGFTFDGELAELADQLYEIMKKFFDSNESDLVKRALIQARRYPPTPRPPAKALSPPHSHPSTMPRSPPPTLIPDVNALTHLHASPVRDPDELSFLTELFGVDRVHRLLLCLIQCPDWQLRAAAPLAIVSASAGQSVRSFIEMLFHLSRDTEEFVIERALRALLALMERLQRRDVVRVVSAVAPILLHPNAWCRHEGVVVVAQAARQLGPVDAYCFLRPILLPFLRPATTPPAPQPHRPCSHSPTAPQPCSHSPTAHSPHGCLPVCLAIGPPPRPPLHSGSPSTRPYMLDQPEHLLHVLLPRSATRAGFEAALKHLLLADHVATLSVAERDRDKLAAMEPYLRELVTQQRHILSNPSAALLSSSSGGAPLLAMPGGGPGGSLAGPMATSSPGGALAPGASPSAGQVQMGLGPAPAPTMAQPAWMPATASSFEQQAYRYYQLVRTPNATTSSPKPLPFPPTPPRLLPFQPGLTIRAFGADFGIAGTSPCPNSAITGDPKTRQTATPRERPRGHRPRPVWGAWRPLARWLVGKHPRQPRTPLTASLRPHLGGWVNPLPFHRWRSRGVLVSHMQEHSQGVNCLAVSQAASLFASCSDDMTVRLWDTRRIMTDEGAAMRSVLTYSSQSGRLTAVTFSADAPSVMAIGSDAGTIHVLDIEAQGELAGLVPEPELYRVEDHPLKLLRTGAEGGPSPAPTKRPANPIQAIESCRLPSQHQALYIAAAAHTGLHVYDPRMEAAWQVGCEPAHGRLTALCVEPSSMWAVTGTDQGVLTLYDLRFQARSPSPHPPLSPSPSSAQPHIPVKVWRLPEATHIHALHQYTPQLHRPYVCVATGLNSLTIFDLSASSGSTAPVVASPPAAGGPSASSGLPTASSTTFTASTLVRVYNAYVEPHVRLQYQERLARMHQACADLHARVLGAGAGATAALGRPGIRPRGQRMYGAVPDPLTLLERSAATLDTECAGGAGGAQEHSVRALWGVPGEAMLLSGGTDRVIRFWDTQDPRNSYRLADPTLGSGGAVAGGPQFQCRATYNDSGVTVVDEEIPFARGSPADYASNPSAVPPLATALGQPVGLSPASGPPTPTGAAGSPEWGGVAPVLLGAGAPESDPLDLSAAYGSLGWGARAPAGGTAPGWRMHGDCITALAGITHPKALLVSASRDGAINIWK
ncbi:putative Phosphoinositide 3-kinase regulatory subunit [Paratrimastix pyriformis]|uniref:non-specific serine/threonine protein kinase n=1 Tax=Paratrimastix pyriformis TaxID=342808 RepID=A0ABQ8UV66_9EUKA|nr:putative Phosphoinositide 3-kinase regulatory subunit [Paratrimastix pyriformis]